MKGKRKKKIRSESIKEDVCLLAWEKRLARKTFDWDARLACWKVFFLKKAQVFVSRFCAGHSFLSCLNKKMVVD